MHLYLINERELIASFVTEAWSFTAAITVYLNFAIWVIETEYEH